jgi:hypothetical protein
VEEKTLPAFAFGSFWDFLLRISSFALAAAAVVGRMWFFTFHQLTVAAYWSGSGFLFLGTLYAGGPSTPHATWRLVAVNPDVAELLTVVTLSEAILGSVPFHLDRDMTEAC